MLAAYMLAFDGMSDIGLKKEIQEDVIYHRTYGKEIELFIIADGVGTVNEEMSPGTIACAEVADYLKRVYEYDEEVFTENFEFFLQMAMYSANRVLGTFHLIDDEAYKGFGTSMTACIVHKNMLYFAHSGNTRLHLIRVNKEGAPVINQLTVDHTEGFEKLARREITEEMYLKGIEKLQLTSGLGVFPDPEIQTSFTRFSKNNIIVMTTDGVHYPLWQTVLLELVLAAENTSSACRALIDAAKIQKYPDNMSSMVVYNLPDENKT